MEYYYTPDGGATVLKSTVNLMDYLTLTNVPQMDITTLEGATLFSVQADDALEIIELTHTQTHDGLLPGDPSIATSSSVAAD